MRSTAGTLFAVLLFTTSPGELWAQAPPPPPPPPPMPMRDATPQKTGTARLSGRVTAIDTGRPIRRAVVRASGPELRDGKSVSTDGEPLARVGFYVPGGAAAYPSSLLMTVVPARVAGVDRITVCSPTPDGEINPAVLAAAHIAALEKLFATRESSRYNLGNGRGYSVREVLRTAAQVTGRKIQTVEAPRREGDPPVLLADATKARNELGWSPAYPDLETMVRHAWQAI